MTASASTRWKSPPEFAREIGVAVEKVHTWIARGELKAINVAARTSSRPRWRIPPESIEAFIAERTAGPSIPRPRTRHKKDRPPGFIEYF